MWTPPLSACTSSTLCEGLRWALASPETLCEHLRWALAPPQPSVKASVERLHLLNPLWRPPLSAWHLLNPLWRPPLSACTSSTLCEGLRWALAPPQPSVKASVERLHLLNPLWRPQLSACTSSTLCEGLRWALASPQPSRTPEVSLPRFCGKSSGWELWLFYLWGEEGVLRLICCFSWFSRHLDIKWPEAIICYYPLHSDSHWCRKLFWSCGLLCEGLFVREAIN